MTAQSWGRYFRAAAYRLSWPVLVALKVGTASSTDGTSLSSRSLADATLVARARNGDLAAASELLSRHQNLAFTAALRLLGERADAEDVAQEALVRAFTRISELQDDASFAPWLRRIAINLSLNALRRRGSLRFESLDAPKPGDESALRSDELIDHRQRTPEDETVTNMMREEIEGLVRRLPADQRAAVVLRDMYEFDMTEVAALQRCGISAAKMRVARGRAALRRLLKQGIPEEKAAEQ
ncbi:MAG: sigma-70 family RNA polymerase sigma factor [Candidatus Eremiobacteraeota bacterium]|nr:sigma-70 family RNA polymerase sigma factor [Candidatus Eremiobacteraeota bacterium]